MSHRKDTYSVMRIARKPGGGVRRFLVIDGLGRQVFGFRAMNRITRRLRARGKRFEVIRHSHHYPTRTHFSPHFSRAEFACHDPQRTPVPRHLESNARQLAISLELVRALMGGTPISLNSVFRTWAWNKHVGGATFSKHMRAIAADINVTSASRRRFLIAAKKVRRIRGIGIYPWGGLHLDIRGGVRVFWSSWIARR